MKTKRRCAESRQLWSRQKEVTKEATHESWEVKNKTWGKHMKSAFSKRNSGHKEPLNKRIDDIKTSRVTKQLEKNSLKAGLLNWRDYIKFFGDCCCTLRFFTCSFEAEKFKPSCIEGSDLTLEVCVLGPAAEWVFGGARLCVGWHRREQTVVALWTSWCPSFHKAISSQ